MFIFGVYILFAKNKTKVNNQIAPISVIICAKNEAGNLKAFLPKILQQNYPSFEVIVVDDQSTDTTWQVLCELKSSYPKLKPIKSDNAINLPGKRKAMKTGLLHASYNHVLVTDADCEPQSNNWIKLMASQFNDNTEIVLGFSPYKKESGFINGLIQYETLYTAIQYFSFAYWGMPYMGVGRNMAFKKSLALHSKTFNVDKQPLSGDDDLLINEIATPDNTAMVWGYDSQVVSLPKRSFTSLLKQKRRHIGAGSYYKPQHKLMLGLLTFSQLTIHLLLPVLLFTLYVKFTLILFLLRLLSMYVIVNGFAKKIKLQNPQFNVVIYDIAMSIFFITLGTLSTYKVKEWQKNQTCQTELRKT